METSKGPTGFECEVGAVLMLRMWKGEECDLRKMFFVRAEGWHALMDGEKRKEASATVRDGQGTGDKDAIQSGSCNVFREFSHYVGELCLLVGAIFSS